MSRKYTYYLKRIGFMILTLWLIITITFFLMNYLPGSPFADQDLLTETQFALLNEKYGFDQPIYIQYWNYLKNILKGDLGVSFQFRNTPVTQLILDRAGPSIQIGLQAMVFGTGVGLILGVISAVYQNTWIDTFTSVFAISGRSIPNFVFAVVLQFVFAVSLSLFPIANWKDGFMSSVLPSLALSLQPMADASRFVRTEMIEVLNSDYIELAKAKGFKRWYIIIRHALRNALIPILTIVGPTTASLMTGSLVIEQIFSIPGIGEQFTKSITTNDYPTIMGVTIMYSTFLVLITLVVDILYGVIDPRMKLSEGGD